MSNQHVLKIHPAPLADLMSGAKTAEVRRNDRGFQVGDTVRLMEVNPDTGNWTGAADQVCTITHIQTGYGLPDDMCVLSYGKVGHDYKAHWMGFMDRTDWMQEKGQVPAKYLGWHRADILTDMLREAREALARVEAERDRFRAVLEGAEYGNIDEIPKFSLDQCQWLGRKVGDMTKSALADRNLLRDQCQAYVRTGNEVLAERDTAQTQLAEAVGVIQNIAQTLEGQEDCRSIRQAHSLRKFLARHAQAEQQEAQSVPVEGPGAHELARLEEEREQLAAEAACYRATLRNVLKDIRDDLARGGLAPSWGGVAETILIVLQQEAQGAQAEPANFGQELEAFEKWRHTQADSLRRCGYPDGADAFIRLGSVQWAGWQARAALATQPAKIKLPDRKPYYGVESTRENVASVAWNRCLDAVKELNAVRGAEHDQ